jgi:uncharacterized protein (TIGR02271 family)
MEFPMPEETVTIPLIEEELAVEKMVVPDGRVEVRTRTEVEKENLDVDLVQQDVEIERIPLNQVVDAAPPVRTEGETTIIPVLEERLVVTKQLILVEEIRMTRKSSVHTQSVSAELRKQRVSVERSDGEE